jgi:hypothetical protein
MSHSPPSLLHSQYPTTVQSLLETRAQVETAVSAGADLVAELAQRVKAALAQEIHAEVEAQVEERAASWSPSFRFNAGASSFLQTALGDDPAAPAPIVVNTQPPAPVTPIPPAAVPADASIAPLPQIATPPAHPLCAAMVCYNGGVCNNQGTCTCPADAMGIRCETKITCNKSTCVNGSCNGNTCVCTVGTGFTGERCDEDTGNRCLNVACLNGGECQKESGSCACFGNFKGERCEIVPPLGQECLNVDCKNGGSCKNGFCNCINGFTGKYCETDPCTGVICQNSGKCESGRCACVNGFYGNRCERDPCKEKKCLNGGKCEAGGCTCFGEWRGTMCEISQKVPAELDTVVPKIPGYEGCQCEVPGSIVNCATLKDKRCANGTLAHVKQMPETISFAGVNPKYPCHTIPCRHGGVCREGACVCKGGYQGLVCEIDKCDEITCQNGGVCHLGKCRCNYGFTGQTCEIDQCKDITCLNGGDCLSGGKCRCPADFTGKFCEIRSKFGNRRHQMGRRLARIVRKAESFTDSLPEVGVLIGPDRVRSDILTMTGHAVASEENQMLKLEDTYSNQITFKGGKNGEAPAPRMKADDRGRAEWHNKRTPEEVAQAIKTMDMPPTSKFRTDHRSLAIAKAVDANATTLHVEQPKLIHKLESMAFVETKTGASNDADADAETELDADAEGEMEADEEVDEEGADYDF